MADGPAGFTRGSTCPALLRMLVGFRRLRVPAFHRLRGDFPDASARLSLAISQSYNPAGTGIPAVWAAPRSLATTGGITFCFLFLRVLRCFSSPGSPPPAREDGSPSDCRVAPFGCPGIKDRLRLPRAFRSLPRPSSPSRATGIRRAPFLAFACRMKPQSGGTSGAYLGLCSCVSRESNLALFCSRMSMNERAPQRSGTCVENNGFEPLTPCLQSRCSSQLS